MAPRCSRRGEGLPAGTPPCPASPVAATVRGQAHSVTELNRTHELSQTSVRSWNVFGRGPPGELEITGNHWKTLEIRGQNQKYQISIKFSAKFTFQLFFFAFALSRGNAPASAPPKSALSWSTNRGRPTHVQTSDFLSGEREEARKGELGGKWKTRREGDEKLHICSERFFRARTQP